MVWYVPLICTSHEDMLKLHHHQPEPLSGGCDGHTPHPPPSDLSACSVRWVLLPPHWPPHTNEMVRDIQREFNESLVYKQESKLFPELNR